MVRVLQVIAVAILSIVLVGATTVERDPACAESPEQYEAFIDALVARNKLEIDFFLITGCGFMRELPATVLERGLLWVKILVDPVVDGVPQIELYTSPGSIVE